MTQRGIPAMARDGTFVENVPADTLQLGNNGHAFAKRAKRAKHANVPNAGDGRRRYLATRERRHSRYEYA